MRLVLGISHAGGRQVVEVEDAPADRPAVVGRGGRATILVPDPSISTRHCLLWLDGDTWYVQDVSGQGGTLVNGEPVVGSMAMAVRDGDVITLGTAEGAPSLEVGLTEENTVVVRPPAQAEGTDDGLDEDEEVPLEGVTAPPAVNAPIHLPVPPPGRSSETIILYFLLACVVIGGGAWFAVNKLLALREARALKAAQGTATTQPGTQPAAPKPDVPRAEARREAPVARMYMEPVPKRASASSNDPVLQSDAWKSVQDAQDGRTHPAQAIWTYLDFMRLHPGKFETELKLDLDYALDRLWWVRLDEIVRRRDRLAREIQEKNNLIARENPGTDEQEAMINQRTSLEEQQKALAEELEGMNFTRREAPNPSDADEVARHRAERDKIKYMAWRKRVLESIAQMRRLPWGSW